MVFSVGKGKDRLRRVRHIIYRHIVDLGRFLLRGVEIVNVVLCHVVLFVVGEARYVGYVGFVVV